MKLTILAFSVLFSVLPTSIASAEGSVNGSFPNKFDTVVVLREPTTIPEIESLFGPSDPQITTFWHDNGDGTWGGFSPVGAHLDQALESYQRVYALDHGGTQPAIFAVQMEGRSDVYIPMGLLADRALVPSWTGVALKRPWLSSDQNLITVVEDAGCNGTVPPLPGGGSEPSPESGSDPRAPWAPYSGFIDANEDGDRFIGNALVFDQQALQSLEGFAYEHDYKLYKPHEDTSHFGERCDKEIGEVPEDALEQDSRPFCGVWTRNDFWAIRGGASWNPTAPNWSWDWDYPDAAGPYVDTDYLDPCWIMDFTVGLSSPGPSTLEADREYRHSFRTGGAANITESVFSLGFQRNSLESCTWIDRLLPGSDVFCIGVGENAGEGTQRMILEGNQAVVPTCIQWFNNEYAAGWNYCLQ